MGNSSRNFKKTILFRDKNVILSQKDIQEIISFFKRKKAI
jgi:hypothetical protein